MNSSSSPNNQEPTPPEPRQSFPARFWQWLKRPSTLIGIGTLGFVVVGGSIAAYIVARRQLPVLIGSQLETILERPVSVGEFEELSLSEIRIAASQMPATETDAGRISIEEIRIEYNLGSLLTQWKLPLTVTIVDPNIYLDQDEEGVWLDLELPPREEPFQLPNLPFDLEATANIEQAEVVLLPQALAAPVEIRADVGGELDYPREGEQQIRYDIDAAFADAPIQVQGATRLDQFATDAQVAIANLSLVKLTALVDDLPVRLDQGQLNVDLDVNVPSLEAYQASQVNGTVDISEVTGQVTLNEDKPAPLLADLSLRLKEQALSIAQGEINFGNILINLFGGANLETGYDLNVAVSPFRLDTVLALVPDGELPVPTEGEFAIDLNVLGAIDQPQLRAVLNATEPTQIDKIELADTVVEVSANLNQIVLDRAEINPATGGQIIGKGSIKTNLKEAIQAGKGIDFTTMPVDFQAGIDLPLSGIAAAYATLPPEVRLGSFNSKVQVEGTAETPNIRANWQLLETFVESIGEIAGQGKARFNGTRFSLQDTGLTTRLGEINIFGFGDLETEQWEASVKSDAVALDPIISELIAQGELEESVEALNIDIRLAGGLDPLTPENVEGQADVTVALGGRALDVESSLQKGRIQGAARAQRLDLQPFVSPFVPQLNLPLGVRQLQANLGGNIAPLLAGKEDFIATLERLEGGLNTVLEIDQSLIDVNGNLARGGQVNANVVTTSPLALTKIVPDLPVEATFEGGTASVSGTVAGLQRVANAKDLAGLTAQTALDLTVAQGAVALAGQLQDGFWDANILVSDVNTTQLGRPVLANFSPEATTLEFPEFNADLAFSGAANPLLQGDRATVNINRANFDWGEQAIAARGEAILANLFTAPDIAEAQLAVNASLDFNSLPTEDILNLVPVDRQYLPQSLEIAGESEFNGRVIAQQLLQAPTAPNSIVLDGDLRLTNFQFNDLVFDPVMTGNLNFATGEEIELALQGENDVILAALDPCVDPACVAPYSLNTLELQQNEGEEDSILVFATGEQNRISATVENFPLSVFRIAPAEEFGVPGPVVGRVNAEANFDLETLATQGNLEVAEPGVGQIGAQLLAIAFSYLDQEARLSQGRLQVGENRFNFEGNYNVASGAIGGNLNLEDGNIQDILAAANISTLQDLSRFTQPLDQGSASDLGTLALGSPEASLGSELALFQETVRTIQARAAERRQSATIDQIDIRGGLELDANVNGTLKNPQLDVAVAGRSWDIRPHSSFPDYTPALGLVIEDAGVVSVDELTIAGNYENGVGTLEEASVILGRGTVSASGQLDAAQLSGNASVENLPLATLLEFAPSPVDATGEIGVDAAISGSLQNPELQGEFSFENASFQGRAIEDDFAGAFSYANSSLELQTTNPEDIDVQVNGEIALPPQPGFENRIVADINIGESGFELLGALSLGQVEWREGKGNIAIAAETSYIDDPTAAIDNLDVNGEVTFEDAVILTTAVAEEVTINGAVELSEDRIQIEELQGMVDETEIAIAGTFPFFTPLSEQNANASPLTVIIDQGRVNIANLYRGRTDANITVQGMALNPIIGGEVRLYEGQVSIPQRNQEARSPVYNRWFGDFAELQGDPPVTVELDDFRVVLNDGFRLVSPPVYKFSLSGDLVLSGSPLDIPSLRSSGAIVLERGEITLFNTDFFLSRLNENRVMFDASRSILNPELDIEMGTTVSDPSRIGQQISPNEIRDDAIRVGQSDTVSVDLVMQGQAQQLLAFLGVVSESEACEAGVEEFLAISESGLSEQNLEREEECLSNAAIASESGSNEELLESPAISLSSSPPRDRGQIIELLAQQFFDLAEQLEQSSGEELLQFGVAEFLIEPLTRDIIFSVNEQATKFAKPIIGVDQALIYPELEGIYQLQEDSFVSVGYDYVFSEFKVRYERLF